jgi:hypothetical protein
MTAISTGRLLRVVLLIQGVVSLIGAVVMAAAPRALPAAVGIIIGRGDYLLPYLLAAAELTVAVLSFGVLRLSDADAVRLIVAAFVVLHLVSAVLTLVYGMLVGAIGTVSPGIVARFVVAAALWVGWLQSPKRD